LGDLFAALERGFSTIRVDFYVVGAFVLRERITRLLTDQTRDPHNSRLGEAMAQGADYLAAEAVHRSGLVLRGIED
jgi:hypothetical protein